MSVSITRVACRAHPFGISLKEISEGTGQMKLQIMQLRHFSSVSFGLRFSSVPFQGLAARVPADDVALAAADARSRS